MKINCDFYNQSKDYNLTSVEKEIVEIIKKNNRNEYHKVIQGDDRLEIILALSDLRRNILDWYPFKENANILEIGANFGEITGLLCDKALKVVSIEGSLKKAQAIKNRHDSYENLELIVGNLEDIKLNEKFDYITLIGTLENIDKIDYNTIDKYICILKKYLKDNGTILLALDNKLGIKYFSKTNLTGINVTNSFKKNIFSLEEIEKKIKSFDLRNKKIYYPMPDYKLTNVIYTDEKPMSKDNLSRNIIYNSQDTIKFYDENPVYREIIQEDNKLFNKFVNSYLIELSNSEITSKDICLISFSNMRKSQYRIKTIVGKEKVFKYAENENSKVHIENIKKNIDIMLECGLKTLDSYDENRIISKYVDAKTLDEIIIELIKENNIEKAIGLMKLFRSELLNKLEKCSSNKNVFDKYKIEYNKEVLNDMTFVKFGLWDLIFQNCFYINNEFFFYDQEWREENLPFEFIIYRSIKYFFRIKKYFSDKELFEIMEINEEKVKLFDELDDRIQYAIRNEIMWKLHNQGTDVMELKRNELTLNHEKNLLSIELEKKDELVNKYQKEINDLRNELSSIYDSKSWKLTKPLRKIKSLKNNKKK